LNLNKEAEPNLRVTPYLTQGEEGGGQGIVGINGVSDKVMREGDDWLMAEQAKACFVLPQREVIAHFAHWDLRPEETEVGSSAYCNVHLSIDISANL
jgi:hypothetical protein